MTGDYTIPVAVPAIGYYEFGITLEQVGYLMVFQWNSKDAAWYFSVYDVAGKPIRRSIKVVLGTYLGKGCQHPLFINGVFVAVDKSAKDQNLGTDATYDDFGTRVILKYIPIVELVRRVAG